jgi:hypothetical protein
MHETPLNGAFLHTKGCGNAIPVKNEEIWPNKKSTNLMDMCLYGYKCDYLYVMYVYKCDYMCINMCINDVV